MNSSKPLPVPRVDAIALQLELRQKAVVPAIGPAVYRYGRLVTWDAELVERAEGLTPAAWLAAEAGADA